MDKEPKEKKEPKAKKEKKEKVVKPKDTTPKEKINFLLVLLPILKYTLLSTVVFAVVGVVIYLTLANLAFFGVLPKKVSERLPIVSTIVKNIEAKELRIKLAKEQKDDLSKIQKAGEFQVDLIEEADVDGENFVPFLYKLRVVKNRINNKELAEIWVDNVLVIKIYFGQGDNFPYARAVYVVKKVNALLNEKADFNQLLPVIDGDIYKAEIMGEELFRVSQEDAIFNNSTQVELLYEWVNNLRVALGASLFQVPKFIVKESDSASQNNKAAIPTANVANVPNAAAQPQTQPNNQAQVAAPGATPEAVPTITDEEKQKEKQLKAVVKVYEKMPEAKVAEILQKMKQDEIVSLLKYLSVKKIAKTLPLITSETAVGVYRKMIGTGTEAEKSKMFKKYMQIWEKIAENDLITIYRKMSIEEKLSIFKKLSVKKKAKLFDAYPVGEAKLYLQLLEETKQVTQNITT